MVEGVVFFVEIMMGFVIIGCFFWVEVCGCFICNWVVFISIIVLGLIVFVCIFGLFFIGYFFDWVYLDYVKVFVSFEVYF